MFNSSMQLTAGDLLTLLVIFAVILAIVMLFNLVFISFSLKRIARRIDVITKEAEGVIMKPLQTVDAAVEWITSFFLSSQGGSHKKKHKHKADDEIVDV